MKSMIKSVYIVSLSFLLFACHNCDTCKEGKTISKDSSANAYSTAAIRDKVLSAEEQKALTPDAVLTALKEGNEKFINNDLTARDHSAMVRDAAAGQYPKAVVLSCLDSRVPVEDVFNEGIGDLFVGRVAGNVVNDELLGSMEFGCKVSGAKLIVVMGHSSCGAVKASIDNVQLGNITSLVKRIQPAVKATDNFQGEKKSKNGEFVDQVAKNNVINTIATIRKQSAILKEMEDKGDIKIVGAMYDLKTGMVSFL
jgi:carbonic anhydrase